MQEAARVLIDDVHDAISDLVELIKTFKSKNKLSKLFLSTLFKRRQDELDAVVDRAIIRLQVSVDHRFGLVAHLALRPVFSWLRSHRVLLLDIERILSCYGCCAWKAFLRWIFRALKALPRCRNVGIVQEYCRVVVCVNCLELACL